MIDIEKQRLFELDDTAETLAASLPPRIREAIDQFVWHGTPPGGFVQAVLSNDLMDAVGRADADSLNAIGAICKYVYNAVPSVCHGSREVVEAHIEAGHKARGFRIAEDTQRALDIIAEEVPNDAKLAKKVEKKKAQA